jgi:hypothetical protein
VRRVIHFSAIGVDRARPSDFSRTKFAAEEELRRRDLDWVILRPSVVVGRPAYGGSALFRGLAALPGFSPVFPEAGKLQIVQLDEIVATVLHFLRDGAPARLALDLAGPRRLTFTDVVLAYRGWLGLPKPWLWPIPSWLQAIAYRLGDAAGLLGWRPPIRSTGRREIARGAVGDPGEWIKVTGIVPRSLDQALAAEPAGVQERWFARLYLLKPVVIGILSLFWLATGFLALGPGYGYGEALMKEGGVEGLPAVLAIVGGGLLDILIGAAIAVRKTARAALRTSIAVAVLYAVIGTVLVPRIWLDPLGPMVKIWPIIVLTVIALATLNDR